MDVFCSGLILVLPVSTTSFCSSVFQSITANVIFRMSSSTGIKDSNVRCSPNFSFSLTTVFLTLFGLASIGLSCLMALFLYHVVFGIPYLGILNGVAAFVIIGIGELESPPRSNNICPGSLHSAQGIWQTPNMNNFQYSAYLCFFTCFSFNVLLFLLYPAVISVFPQVWMMFLCSSAPSDRPFI